MKNFNEKEILQNIKDSNPYQIKTTSQDILNKFNKSKALEIEKKEQVKNKKLLLGSSIGLLGTSLLTITLIVILNKKQDNPYLQVISPAQNEIFAQELITFSNFYQQETSLQAKKRLNQSASQDDFVKIVNTYDSIESGVFSTFHLDEYTIEETQFNQYYLNINFDYRCTFSINNEIIATLYYNQIDQKIEDDEIETKYQAIYNTNNQDFKVLIEQEIEKDEKEIEVMFTNLSNNNSNIHIVTKESEIEQNESEISFSYSIYKNINDYYDENAIYSIEYNIEKENSKNKLEIQILDNNKQYEFKNIKEEGNIIKFNAEFESNNNDVELNITLTYYNDYRIYSAPNLDEIKKI